MAGARAGYGFRDTLAWDIRCFGFRLVLLLYLRLRFGARAGNGFRDTLGWGARRLWV